MAEQGTEVNKNSTNYTSVVSPQKKKKKKKKEKKNKERVLGQTRQGYIYTEYYESTVQNQVRIMERSE